MKIKTRWRLEMVAGVLLLASSTSHTQTVAPELRARFELAPTVTSARPLGTFLGGEVLSVINAPFSGVGTMTHVHKFLDGNRVTRKERTTYYRDGQGRVRIERTLGALGMGMALPSLVLVSITDPINGRTINLQQQTKTYYELPSYAALPPPQPPVKGSPPQVQTVLFGTIFFGGGMAPDNLKEIPLGEKTIDGVRVVGTRVEQTIPAGSVGNERAIISTAESWFSEELGAVIESKQRSPTGIESTYRLSQILRGEPASDLFSAPPDYTRQEVNSGVGPGLRALPPNPVPSSR